MKHKYHEKSNTHQGESRREMRSVVDRAMDPLYDMIRRAAPLGGASDAKYMGRRDNNDPAKDDRGC